MAGKPTIPARVHARVRRLYRKGIGKKAIAAEVGHSLYTVRKALDPDFADREAARHRETGAVRYASRKVDPEYIAYQADANASAEHRDRCRETMRRLRARQRQSKS